MINRTKGILYGVAIGDALGATTEFCTQEEVKQRHGILKDIIGGGWLNVKPGEGTDDTDMTLAVAQGIIDNPDDPVESVGKHFVEWYRRNPEDMGISCKRAISKALELSKNAAPTRNNWMLAALEAHRATGGRSAGNGSLMRTAYPAMFYRDVTKAMRVADDISQMTHFDQLAATACRVYTEMLYWLIDEPDIRIRRDYLITAARDARYVFAIEPDYIPNPSGFVVDTFATVLHCILTTRSFEEALIKTVNLGGDADTTGAIAGGLAGALYGYDRIPTRWVLALAPATVRKVNEFTDAAIEHKFGVHTVLAVD